MMSDFFFYQKLNIFLVCSFLFCLNFLFAVLGPAWQQRWSDISSPQGKGEDKVLLLPFAGKGHLRGLLTGCSGTPVPKRFPLTLQKSGLVIASDDLGPDFHWPLLFPSQSIQREASSFSWMKVEVQGPSLVPINIMIRRHRRFSTGQLG